MNRFGMDASDYFTSTVNYKSLTRIEGTFRKLSRHMSELTAKFKSKHRLLPFLVLLAITAGSFVFSRFAFQGIIAAICINLLVTYYYMLLVWARDGKLFMRIFFCFVPGAHIGVACGFGIHYGIGGIQYANFFELALIIIASGCFTMILHSFYIVRSLKKAVPQELELDYIMKIFKSILQEFPEDVGATVRFNPFLNQWSETKIAPTKEKWGYTFNHTADLLGSMAMTLPDKMKFHLNIFHLKQTKIKNRKSKFKGCKHKTIYEFLFKLPDFNSEDNIDISQVVYDDLKSMYKIHTEKKQKKLIPGIEFPNPFNGDVLKIKSQVKQNKLLVRVSFKSEDRTHENRDKLTPINLIPPILVLSVIKVATDSLIALKEELAE